MSKSNAQGVPLIGLDTLAWMLALVGLLWLRVSVQGAEPLMQDSLQYISISTNALDGRIAQTSLVHFDAERSFGVIPAPVVTFPPAYGLAIAMLAAIDVPPEAAGLALTAAATVASVAVMAWVSGFLGLSAGLRNVAVGAYVVNATVLTMGARVLTDMPFAFLVLLGVALQLRGDRSTDRASWTWAAAAGVVFALAYAVRYAGMFIVIGVAVAAGLHVLMGRPQVAARRALTAAVGCAAIAAGIARNIALVGNWRGGNEKDVSNPLLGVVAETLRGFNRLLLGPGTGLPGGTAGLRIACIALLVLGAVWLWRSATRARPAVGSGRSKLATGVIDMCIIAAVYLACMFYAGLKTVIDYGHPRYLVPVLPLVLLLVAVALGRLMTDANARTLSARPPALALLLSLLLYAGLNLLLLRSPPEQGWQRLVQQIDARKDGGESARDAVHRLTGPSGVVMANDGQVLGYMLERPTISLVGPHYSNTRWDEATISRTIRRFDVKALVLHVPADESSQSDGDLVPSEFVRRLLRGDSPSWLVAVHRSPGLLVYAPQGEASGPKDQP